jgi:hypothetical protein
MGAAAAGATDMSQCGMDTIDGEVMSAFTQASLLGSSSTFVEN